MMKLKERMNGQCECILVADDALKPRTLRVSHTPQISLNQTEPGKVEACLRIDKLSKKEQDLAGMCVQSKAGSLVYGVRQWHGVTSLCVTLIITPLSIFIARYSKGEMVIIEEKVPLKAWYISHILLVFPAIWMYASGFATISRQKDVVGYSYTLGAFLHRALGIATFAFIPLQFVTGFFRPTNLFWRRIVIFIHWAGGIAQHFLELLLCIFSSHIPASPTSSRSMFSPEFGQLSASTVACLIIGWFAFSACFHIFLMIRIKRQDVAAGMGSRSVFPIIIPLLATGGDDLDISPSNKDIWFERGALLIFSLVSCIIFAVSIVSLYQALHDNVYYGFGKMTCTHHEDGTLINSTTGQC